MAFEKDKTIKSTYRFGKGEVVFDTVNEFRLVSPEITAGIALAIQKWTDANLHYLFDINSLIPENIGKDDNLNRYSEYFVNSSYDLLKHNCVLTFNEALFILLGFNCVLAPDLDDYSINTSSHLIDKKLVRQSPGQDLKSFFANQEYKLTKTFLDWAENLNFITTLTDIKISNEEVAKLKQRPETIKKQRIITIEAKEILKNNPTLKREFLADDIEQRLIDKHKITNLTSTAIVRDYLKDYQKLKQEAKDYQKSQLKESKKP